MVRWHQINQNRGSKFLQRQSKHTSNKGAGQKKQIGRLNKKPIIMKLDEKAFDVVTALCRRCVPLVKGQGEQEASGIFNSKRKHMSNAYVPEVLPMLVFFLLFFSFKATKNRSKTHTHIQRRWRPNAWWEVFQLPVQTERQLATFQKNSLIIPTPQYNRL